MSNLTVKNTQNSALSVYKPILHHPAIVSAGKTIKDAAARVDMRAEFGAKAIGRGPALRGLFNEVTEIINRMGVKQANRPSNELIALFAESVLEAHPCIIIGEPSKGIAGELISAYKAAVTGNLGDVDLRLWGDGPNDQLFISLATAYRLKQAPDESLASAKVREYIAPEPQKAVIEAATFQIAALASALLALPAKREEPYTRADMPTPLAFGFAYDIMVTAGLINNSKEQKLEALKQAAGLIESEARANIADAQKKQGAPYASRPFNSILQAYRDSAGPEVEKSTAKDLLFVAWLNSEPDFKQAANVLTQNKQNIIKKEIERRLSKQNQ